MSSPISSPASASTSTPAQPQVSIALSLSPLTNNFGSPPPTLHITATSHASGPITLYTGFSILDPKYGLMMRQFRITDLETGVPVNQQVVRFQMQGPNRNRGSPSDKLFLTLLPGKPVTISEPFGPENAMAINDPRRVGTLPNGNRRSLQVLGVDGLEIGKQYTLGIADDASWCWWKFGTRDDILVPPGKCVGLGDGDGRINFDAGDIHEVKFSIEG